MERAYDLAAGSEVRLILFASQAAELVPKSSDATVTALGEIFGALVGNGQKVRLFANGEIRGFTFLALVDCTLVVTAEGKVHQNATAHHLKRLPSVPNRPSPLAVGSSAILSDFSLYLNQRRRAVKGTEDELGPRVLVCSAHQSSGKSTIVRTLANHAQRSGYFPIIINSDTSCPGCLGWPQSLTAAVVQHPIDPEEGMTFWPVLMQPLGIQDAQENLDLFKAALSLLLETVEEKSLDDRIRASGMIIDTPTVDPSDARSLTFLRAIIETCTVDHVVVLGSDRLRHRLRECLINSNATLASSSTGDRFLATASTEVTASTGAQIKLINVAGIENAMVKSMADVNQSKIALWRRYFFGTATAPLKPLLMEFPISSVRFLKFGTVSEGAMDGLMPIQDDAAADASASPTVPSISVRTVSPGEIDLRHRVVSILNCSFNPLPSEDVQLHDENSTIETEASSALGTGFGIVTLISSSHVQLLVSAESALPESLQGIVLMITEAVIPVSA